MPNMGKSPACLAKYRTLAIEQRRLIARKLVFYSARCFLLPAEGVRARWHAATPGRDLAEPLPGLLREVMPLFVLIQKRHLIKWRQPRRARCRAVPIVFRATLRLPSLGITLSSSGAR